MDKQRLCELIKIQKEKSGALILAHTYQPPEITDIADVTGDSYALAKAATEYGNKEVIVCGVRFMAETVKLLSPEKRVVLPAPDASCPMAEQISPERVKKFKKEHPDAAVVAYVNTSAALKAECDVCITSSSAVKIVSAIENKDILFIPDKNLGAFVQKQLPEKNIILWDGFCPVHNSVSADDAKNAKEKYKSALLAVHPECPGEVLQYADYIGSTAGIIDFAVKAQKPVIIGTEGGVYDTLILKHRDRTFYQLTPEKLICPDMKKTSLNDVYNALTGSSGEEIELDGELMKKARICLDNMLKYGG